MFNTSQFPKLIVLGSLFFALMGCSSTKILWDKPGGTQEEFNRDRYACVQESRVSWSGGGTGGLGLVMIFSSKSHADKQALELFNMCMEARGYTGKEVTEEEFTKQNEQEILIKYRAKEQAEKLRFQKEAEDKAKQDLLDERR